MNLNNMLRQQPQQLPLKNTNLTPPNSNNFNFQNLTSSSSSYDTLGLLILIAMLIKACAQIPLIIKITQSKSAEDVSIISPIMFLVSFSILGAISLNRRLYLPLLIFTIGIATSIILIIQVLRILFSVSISILWGDRQVPLLMFLLLSTKSKS